VLLRFGTVEEVTTNVATAGLGSLAESRRRQVLDPEREAAIEEQRARRARRLATRDRVSGFVVGGGFVLVASALAFSLPTDRHPAPVLVAALVVSYALAYRLDFEVGRGSAVPTQLLLVPMLFALPAGVVPLCVAGAILLANLIDLVRGLIHFERLLLRVAYGAWHAVGPALVLAVAGEPRPSLAHWWLYIAALLAQFGLDFAVTAIRGALVFAARPAAQLSTMASVYLMDAALAPIGLAVAFAADKDGAGFLLALPLVSLLAVFARERRVRIDHALELGHAYRGTAYLLGDVIEADDAYTGSHSRDVVELSLKVADALGLNARERHDAEFAALLHDVGKVRISNEIINKAGPLSPDERRIMDEHTIHGERMLEQVGGLLGDVGRIVRSCHERYDGGGYPDGLAGEQIPLTARIVSCCDAFNAMTSDRSYRRALPLAEALAELRANSGTQFDPRVVDALARTVSAPRS
jgi:HD-GYP domain-containing protein (c-di-GMP phosphodiesterase class II)